MHIEILDPELFYSVSKVWRLNGAKNVCLTMTGFLAVLVLLGSSSYLPMGWGARIGFIFGSVLFAFTCETIRDLQISAIRDHARQLSDWCEHNGIDASWQDIQKRTPGAEKWDRNKLFPPKAA